MVESELILTEEQAISYGLALQVPLQSIARTAELSRLHGDTVASLYRVEALKQFRKVVSAEEIKALIIAAAGDGYEVAESGTFKLDDAQKLEGAIRAMQKGYLLSDEAGPHFTVIVGKGGVSVLIKESGHRHKLKRAGCRSVDVVAAATKMRLRPNASGKYDMIVEGRASCVINGEIIEVQRGSDFPIILPCYESDGPDGHEAKARRRLLRDLWAKVSGDFEPIELDEVESEHNENSPVVVESVSARIIAPDVAPQPKPDVPPAISAVLNEWRPKLTSENKTLTAMAKRIAAVRTPNESLAIEADLSSMKDHNARNLLTDFLKAILAVLA